MGIPEGNPPLHHLIQVRRLDTQLFIQLRHRVHSHIIRQDHDDIRFSPLPALPHSPSLQLVQHLLLTPFSEKTYSYRLPDYTSYTPQIATIGTPKTLFITNIPVIRLGDYLNSFMTQFDRLTCNICITLYTFLTQLDSMKLSLLSLITIMLLCLDGSAEPSAKLLYEDDFSNDLSKWVIEQAPGGTNENE